ncbi:MAG: RND family transporter [Candidatus Binatia bacterium]
MTSRIGEAWLGFCLAHRKVILLALAAISVLAAVQLRGARFDNALELWFLQDDPALLAHHRLLETFGSDDLIIVGLEAPDVFAPEVLRTIDRLTHRLEKAPHVEKVFSLTNIEAIDGGNDALEIHELVEFPLDVESLGELRERALANELYVGNVVSASGDFACIVVRLPHRADDFDYKVEAIDSIREALGEERDVKLYLSGGPVIDEQLFFLSEVDSQSTTVLMLGLLVAVLWLLMKSAAGVLLPLCTVILATVWGMGWIVLCGRAMNFATIMLPPLLLAVGVADSMHIIVDYRNHCAKGEDQPSALRSVFRELMAPLFLTSLTTALGLLSLLISKVEGIREFGAFAALGVAGAFVLSVSMVPIVLSYLPPPRKPRPGGTALSARSLERLHLFTMKRGPAIVAVSVVLVAAGVAAGTRVRAESVLLEYFKEDQQIRIDTLRIEEALAGTFTVDVMVDTGREDGVKDPAVLQEIVALQAFLETQAGVSSTQSVADYFKDLRRAFFDNDQREYRLPQTREEAAQYLLLYEMDAPDGDILEYVTFDYSQARVSARLDLHSSTEAARLVESLGLYIDREFPPQLEGTIAGVALLYAHMEDYIRESLIKGYSLALVAIFFIMCLHMGSIGLGAMAMIPNVVPIILCLGFMGLTGIVLDTMTAMVASIAIGLAVDDSIHFVSRVHIHIQKGLDMGGALRRATVEMGRALVYTSVTLSAGFGVLMTASFQPTVHFGMLCLLTIVIALLADLLLLPVVLRWYDDRREAATLMKPLLGWGSGESSSWYRARRSNTD